MTSTKDQATGIIVFGPSPCPRHGLDYSEACRDCDHHRYPVPYDPPPVWPRPDAIETSENPDVI